MSAILFPCFVYRSPGPHPQQGGGTYQYRQVLDQNTLDSLLADSWYLSSQEAVDAMGFEPVPDKKGNRKKKPEKKPRPSKPIDGINHRLLGEQAKHAPAQPPSTPVIPDDEAAPTRAELDHMARQLGLKSTKKLSDVQLAELIEKAVDG